MVGVEVALIGLEAVAGAKLIVADDSWKAARRCAGPKCGAEFIPKRHRQRFAPDHRRCRRKHWELHHPRRGVKHPDRWNNRQAMWPTMHALLALLRVRPATVQDLFAAAGPGFSTCVSKLRAKSHSIKYDRQIKLYRLEQR